ncbi:hypothetical protein J1N35_027843 [Gossypium stocksii]|uniref:DUF4283 domain-containing protein n=1 Tax=Gossypium stocksii TaxID=47602 RepID=A0A9D3VB11_9ROSI|nr:hypothetical protein J1N35_027843 [Gossypium stocksii]
MEVLRLHLLRKFSVLVLDHWPWHIRNKRMLARKCEPSIKRPDFDLHKLPVWVHLSYIPLELCYGARAIGVPLYTDTITAGQSRLVYAKVCVEIDANQIIPRTIDIILKDSSTRILWVEVPWIPQRCSKYSIFGHVDKACPKKLTEINKVQGYFTAIYGRNESRERCRLWEHLKDIQQGVGGNPLFLAGDFNVIADIKESLGSRCSSQLMRDIEEFLKCINGLELQDHLYFGPTYTWSNLQKESYLARKLDSDD